VAQKNGGQRGIVIPLHIDRIVALGGFISPGDIMADIDTAIDYSGTSQQNAEKGEPP